VFIETSPHPVLTGAITDALEHQRRESDGGGGSAWEPIVTGTLRRDDGGPARVLASLAEAHAHGVAVDWSAVLPAGQRIELPTYAFQRQRYWPRPASAGARDQRCAGAERGFWAAVEGGDLEGLSHTLDVDERHLNEVLPALAAWRPARERAVDRRRLALPHHLAVARSARRGGVVGYLAGRGAGGSADHPPIADCVKALTGRGALVSLVAVEPGEWDRHSLRHRLTDAAGECGDGLSGIVSLLALDESLADGSPVVAVGWSQRWAWSRPLATRGSPHRCGC